MGLAQQIAYSSLLAFFPAVAFLVGALGLFNLFDDVKSLLDPIAPNGVIKFITSLQQDSRGGTSARWHSSSVSSARSGQPAARWRSVIKAMNRAYELQETRPIWKVRGNRDPARRPERDHDRRRLPAHRRRRGARQRDLEEGRSRRGVRLGLGNRALAGRVLRDPPVLRPRVLPRAEQGASEAGSGSRRARSSAACSGCCCRASSRSTSTSPGTTPRRTATLASGVILLLWLNYSAFALLFGAELNAELDRQADIRAAGGERAGLVKLARRGA